MMSHHKSVREGTSQDISPITPEEFEALMASLSPFEPNPRVAVAVSGGPDSMALSLLLREWVQKHHGTLYALSVDHGLREGSSCEARRVQDWMKNLAIFHEVLEWHGEKPKTHIQEKARLARYALLENYCREKHIFHLFLAHHLEDQVETFWLRFLRKSGTDGLAAMPVIQTTPFLRKIRPCLNISKARLSATLTAFNQDYVKDPSNENMDFQRVKIRAHEETFEALGLTPNLIQGLIQKNAWVKDTLQHETLKALVDGAELSPLGYVILQRDLFRSTPFEISRRVLEKAVMCIGGSAYSPRWESLIPILQSLRSHEADFLTKTVGHVLLKKKKDVLFVMPERRKEDARDLKFEDLLSTAENSFMWQERFLIKFSEKNFGQDESFKRKDLFLKPLGKKGRALLTEKNIESAPHPWEVLESLPSLWEGEHLLSVPHLKWGIKAWVSAGFEEELFFYPKTPLSR